MTAPQDDVSGGLLDQQPPRPLEPDAGAAASGVGGQHHLVELAVVHGIRGVRAPLQVMTDAAGTETGSSGVTDSGSGLLATERATMPRALEGDELEAGARRRERHVARRQRLLAGQQVGGLDVERLVLDLHERDLAVLVGEDHLARCR